MGICDFMTMYHQQEQSPCDWWYLTHFFIFSNMAFTFLQGDIITAHILGCVDAMAHAWFGQDAFWAGYGTVLFQSPICAYLWIGGWYKILLLHKYCTDQGISMGCASVCVSTIRCPKHDAFMQLKFYLYLW